MTLYVMEWEAAVKTIDAANTAKVEELQDLGYRIVATKETAHAAKAKAEVQAAKSPEAKPKSGLSDSGLTVAEIKARLEAAGVGYPGSARKDMLVSIAQANGVAL
ncbi:hypothetical protein ACKQTC_03030 [Peptococcus simiae]|uniref:HeH/LEM domain-containing protein n=1 Tax=Peptococcus simiae TaxID=1643805 RepID=A0ABW9GXH0_9FIRM